MKVISGGQTGADQAGLAAAKFVGFQTGGTAPLHFKTLEGPNTTLRDVYGLTESHSPQYPPRTEENAENSDGTIRLAFNFNSRGEKCTLKAIKKFNKPYLDVDLSDIPDATVVANWILGNDIKTLNIAGNAGDVVFDLAFKFLVNVFEEMGRLKEDIF